MTTNDRPITCEWYERRSPDDRRCKSYADGACNYILHPEDGVCTEWKKVNTPKAISAKIKQERERMVIELTRQREEQERQAAAQKVEESELEASQENRREDEEDRVRREENMRTLTELRSKRQEAESQAEVERKERKIVDLTKRILHYRDAYKTSVTKQIEDQTIVFALDETPKQVAEKIRRAVMSKGRTKWRDST